MVRRPSMPSRLRFFAGLPLLVVCIFLCAYLFQGCLIQRTIDRELASIAEKGEPFAAYDPADPNHDGLGFVRDPDQTAVVNIVPLLTEFESQIRLVEWRGMGDLGTAVYPSYDLRGMNARLRTNQAPVNVVEWETFSRSNRAARANLELLLSPRRDLFVDPPTRDHGVGNA